MHLKSRVSITVLDARPKKTQANKNSTDSYEVKIKGNENTGERTNEREPYGAVRVGGVEEEQS